MAKHVHGRRANDNEFARCRGHTHDTHRQPRSVTPDHWSAPHNGMCAHTPAAAIDRVATVINKLLGNYVRGGLYFREHGFVAITWLFDLGTFCMLFIWLGLFERSRWSDKFDPSIFWPVVLFNSHGTPRAFLPRVAAAFIVHSWYMYVLLMLIAEFITSVTFVVLWYILHGDARFPNSWNCDLTFWSG